MSRECPVCGESFLYTDHVPKNPSPDHEPDQNGTAYVHSADTGESDRHRITDVCTLWEDGTSDHRLDVKDGEDA